MRRWILLLAASAALALSGILPSWMECGLDSRAAAGVAVRSGGSPVVFYASQSGVKFDGSDQSATLQAILDRGQTGPITLVIDGSCTAKGLKLYSNTTVEGLGWGTTITQATASTVQDGCVFRNANYRSAYQGASIVDSNIAIRNIAIDGARRNGSSGVPYTGGQSATFTPDGFPCTPIRMWGVMNPHVENVYIYDPCSYAVSYANTSGIATVRDLKVIVPTALGSTPVIGDGTNPVQLDGPWEKVVIEGVSGSSGDDFIALNACDGNMASGEEVIGSFPIFYYGSGQSVIVRGLQADCCGSVVRLLTGAPGAGSPAAGQPIASIGSVLVEGVQATVHAGTFYCDGFLDLEPGAIGDITFKDWDLTYAPGITLSTFVNKIGNATIGSFTFQGFRTGNVPGAGNPLITVETNTTIGRLRLADYTIREDSSESATPVQTLSVTGGAIDELVLEAVGYARNSATSGSILSVSGGTINRIEMSGVSASNLSNLVSVSGGTVGGINSVGITHRGAGGGASIAQTGGTLSRLRAAGSDTALLASGTIAGGDKKTDGTEDS